MENQNQVSNNNEIVEGGIETPVQQKEGLWTKTKKFGKKHKKGLIAGAIAVVGTVLFCATRKSDDDDCDFVESESEEMDTTVETTEE